MKQLLLIACIITSCWQIHAQNLTITKDNRVKEFAYNSLFEFKLEQYTNNQEDCYNCAVLRGHITNVKEDSIGLSLLSVMLWKQQDPKNPGRTIGSFESRSFDKIAKENIVGFRHHASKKSEKLKRSLMITGSVLILTGLGTIISYLATEESDGLKYAGLAQAGVGLTLGFVFSPREYELKGEDPWSFEE